MFSQRCQYVSSLSGNHCHEPVGITGNKFCSGHQLHTYTYYSPTMCLDQDGKVRVSDEDVERIARRVVALMAAGKET